MIFAQDLFPASSMDVIRVLFFTFLWIAICLSFFLPWLSGYNKVRNFKERFPDTPEGNERLSSEIDDYERALREDFLSYQGQCELDHLKEIQRERYEKYIHVSV